MIDDLVIKNFDRLTDTDRHIWKVIKARKNSVSILNLDELAQRCNVSPSAIVRFQKEYLYKDSHELKYLIKQENIPHKVNQDIFQQYKNQLNEFVTILLGETLLIFVRTSLIVRRYLFMEQVLYKGI